MADYECHALWDAGTNVDPHSIGLPIEFAEALEKWAGEYTATLNHSYPPDSGFPDESTAEAWLERGDRLAAGLHRHGFAVDYFHRNQTASQLVAGS